MQTIDLGANADRSRNVLYHDPGGHLLFTGPHVGEIELPDGTTVDVTAPVVSLPSQLHALQAAVHLAGNDASEVTQDDVDALNAGEAGDELLALMRPARGGN